MFTTRQPPSDSRAFVHKRIIGGLGGFLSGGPLGALSGFSSSGRSGGSPVPPVGGGRNFGAAPGDCTWPARPDPNTGRCRVFLGDEPGRDRPGTAMTRTGVYAPTTVTSQRRECSPGDILGRDGLCHAKGSIPNKERAYPRGRRPLGTPGEMAALAKAASFGRRMESTVKRMQKLGVLKKPSRGRRFSPPHRQRQLAPGPSIINVE